MRILVTGATGFIGRHFVARAMLHGYEVLALRRSTSVRSTVIGPEPTWITKPLDELTASDFRGVEAVVHLAAHSANVPYDSYSQCMYWNATAVLKMVGIAFSAGVCKYLITGTCFEYGSAANRYDRIPPDAPLEPQLSYPASKAAASLALQAWAAERWVSLHLVRLFQIFGEGEQPSRFWPSLRRAALSGDGFKMSLGEQIRDFSDVQHVAAGLVDQLGFSRVKPGLPLIENAGTGRPQSLRTFAQRWWSEWNATGTLEFGAIAYRKGEVMRLVPELGLTFSE